MDAEPPIASFLKSMLIDGGPVNAVIRRQPVTMTFSIGEHVVMLRHADWKADACATIAAGPRERNGRIEYVIDFDEPQADFTDEMNGLTDRTYKSTTVLAEFLQSPEPHLKQESVHSSDASWRDVYRFYDELIESGWQVSPLKELAIAIGVSEIGKRIFASTSHAALGISTVAQYHARLGCPMVYVEYNADTARFTIHFQEYQGKPDHEVESRSPMTDGTMDLIRSWLRLEP